MTSAASLWIEGRPYRLGAAYLPVVVARIGSNRARTPRRLLGYDPTYPWVSGRVSVEVLGRVTTRAGMTGRAWVAWAGEVAP